MQDAVHPFRTQHRAPAPPPAPEAGDDRSLLGVALMVGATECVAQLLAGGRWGAQATLGMLLVVTSAVLLIRGYRTGRR